MRGGALPPALLAVALGLALAFAPRRTLKFTLPTFAIVAALVSLWRPPPAWIDAIFLGCWIGVIACATCVYLPARLGPRGAVGLSAMAGVFAGAVIAAAGSPVDLVKALPWVFVCAPAAWIVAHRRGVAIKVGAGWLAAVAVLAATVPFAAGTPGYEADHMQ